MRISIDYDTNKKKYKIIYKYKNINKENIANKTHSGNILCSRSSVFCFSSKSKRVRSLTRSSRLFAYFSIISIIWSIILRCQPAFIFFNLVLIALKSGLSSGLSAQQSVIVLTIYSAQSASDSDSMSTLGLNGGSPSSGNLFTRSMISVNLLTVIFYFFCSYTFWQMPINKRLSLQF